MTNESITYQDAGVDIEAAALNTPHYQIGRIIPGEARVTYRT